MVSLRLSSALKPVRVTMAVLIALVVITFGSVLPHSSTPFSAPGAEAATLLDGLDLAGYCSDKYSTYWGVFNSTGIVRLVDHNAGGWKCFALTSHVWFYQGANWYDADVSQEVFEYDIDTYDVCRWQYNRGDAWAHTDNWDDPYSWRCYV